MARHRSRDTNANAAESPDLVRRACKERELRSREELTAEPINHPLVEANTYNAKQTAYEPGRPSCNGGADKARGAEVVDDFRRNIKHEPGRHATGNHVLDSAHSEES